MMRPLLRTAAACAALAFLAACQTSADGRPPTAFLRDLLDVGPGRNENPLQPHGLADIFTDFDPAKPVSTQWPHVALTVIKAPSFHAKDRSGIGSRDGIPPYSGCWTIRARVWHSAKSSENKTFDWCYKRHATFNRGTPTATQSVKILNPNETTGVRFTEGPTPPNGYVPLDAAHRRFFSRDSGLNFTAGDDVLWITMTMDGLMFTNIAHQMGFGMDPQDPRLWIAAFEEAKR